MNFPKLLSQGPTFGQYRQNWKYRNIFKCQEAWRFLKLIAVVVTVLSRINNSCIYQKLLLFYHLLFIYYLLLQLLVLVNFSVPWNISKSEEGTGKKKGEIIHCILVHRQVSTWNSMEVFCRARLLPAHFFLMAKEPGCTQSELRSEELTLQYLLAKGRLTNSMHFLHIIDPQRRQWWRRFRILNLLPQSGQNGTSWSLTQGTTDFSIAVSRKAHHVSIQLITG